MSTTNIHFTLIQNSKSLVKNADFECRYIMTHTKEKPTKISNIILAISAFYQKNYSNWIAILSTFESTTPDETIIYASKCLILT